MAAHSYAKVNFKGYLSKCPQIYGQVEERSTQITISITSSVYGGIAYPSEAMRRCKAAQTAITHAHMISWQQSNLQTDRQRVYIFSQ